MSYYKKELENVLKDGNIGYYGANLKIQSEFGSTKWIRLNQESAREIIKFLETKILKK